MKIDIKSDKNLSLIIFLFLATIISATFLCLLIHHTPQKISKENVLQCPQILGETEVEITDNGFEPKIIKSKACTKLHLINNSKSTRKIAFGEHEEHIKYPGFSEKLISGGQSIAIVLSAKGEFEIHDHFNEDTKATLIIE